MAKNDYLCCICEKPVDYQVLLMVDKLIESEAYFPITVHDESMEFTHLNQAQDDFWLNYCEKCFLSTKNKLKKAWR